MRWQGREGKGREGFIIIDWVDWIRRDWIVRKRGGKCKSGHTHTQCFLASPVPNANLRRVSGLQLCMLSTGFISPVITGVSHYIGPTHDDAWDDGMDGPGMKITMQLHVYFLCTILCTAKQIK